MMKNTVLDYIIINKKQIKHFKKAVALKFERVKTFDNIT